MVLNLDLNTILTKMMIFFYNGRKDYTDVYWHAQHKNIFLRLKYMFRSSSLLLFDLEALSFIYPCAIT